MPTEYCSECGFDGSQWTDEQAIEAISKLSSQWAAAVESLSATELNRRPVADMWSIGEYTDHVREVLFGMRFVLDIAVSEPGTDLGEPPEPQFASVPKPIDITAALHGITTEATELRQRLISLQPFEWNAQATFDGQTHDAHWICRHAAHDANHHLNDIERLRQLIETPT